ncbi:MAG: peptide-methionine (S)-S-oxide reductase MsrA [Proteobacteria bacterium]|nr:peptide-methionine (S)-S-oxide reductase MsrA [Pseudomonadota bacterium]
MATATFGAGCFWGVEADFQKVEGVTATEVGYAGGSTGNPSYEDICTGETGHAEVVRLEFDPAIVSFEALLQVLWNSHDPTTMNRQGADRGTQYRSVIFFHDEAQRQAAEASKAALDASGRFSDPAVTAIEPADSYYAAEDYHQKYFEKQGIAACPV